MDLGLQENVRLSRAGRRYRTPGRGPLVGGGCDVGFCAQRGGRRRRTCRLV